jgi:ATP-dependent helicase/nuclease subunit A
MPTPTKEQLVAIQTQDRSLAVEAGAGTGKTWVLVERFVHLLETHPDWPLDALVAITFTEKAAREMRDRVRRAIEERSASDNGSIWAERRLQLDRLQISTVHSLCARILRENAIAAEIDPAFAVLDAQAAQLLQAEAIRQSIRELVDADSPALNLLVWLRVQDLQNEMAGLLSKRGTVQRLFETLPQVDELLARWQQGLDEMRRVMWVTLQAHTPLLVDALSEIPRMTAMPADDKLTHVVQQAQQGCRLWEDGVWAEAVVQWQAIKINVGSKKSWGEERLAEVKALLKALREGGKTLERAGAISEIGPADHRAAQALHLWRDLWTALEQVYGRLKEEQHVLDFDDLELLTARLLREKATTDQRLQVYLAGIRHVMVDEYQDTNPLQQEIVYALAPLDQPGRLFIVGDPKQSIYRFRQAQVAIFNRTAQDLYSVNGHQAERLSGSFRSHSALVATVNHLFDRLLQPLDGVTYTDYEAQPGPLTAHRDPAAAYPPVEITLLARKTSDGNTIYAEDARIWEADLLARRLLELESSGFPVWDKHTEQVRAFRFGDAAVLLRATTNLHLVEERFKVAGVPYLTVSGRGYYDRPEIQDLLSLLAVLYNPGDDLSLAAALRSPLFSLSDETLFRLRRRTDQNEPAPAPIPFLQALVTPPPTDQPDQVAHTCSVLSDLLDLAGRVDVWRLLYHAIERTGYLAALALAEQAEKSEGRRVGNVQKFLAMARDRGGANIAEFLLRVQDLQTAEAREGQVEGRRPESGAVQLMSIHAAKGLEFPVVAVADLGRGSGRGGAPSRIYHDPAFGLVCQVRDEQGDWEESVGLRWARWMEAQMETAEAHRLLYVACTRAADLLLLSGQLGNASSWLHEILQAWEIDSGSDGEDEESLLSFEDCQVRLVRPFYAQPAEPEEVAAAGIYPGLDRVPPLANPLLVTESPAQIAVTRLARTLARDPDELPVVYPAVRPQPGDGSGRRVPGYLLGNLVHQILADWDCLHWSHPQLLDHIRRTARMVGILDLEGIHAATDRAIGMVRVLHRSRLYQEIGRAQAKIVEAPFTLDTPLGTLHGVIDLLYQDDTGQWHLVDWKTEWVQKTTVENAARDHLPQLAVYARAAEQLLGNRPAVDLCFLAANAVTYPIRAEELDDTWSRLQEGHGE